MQKKIAILGSTGSIGTQTLDIIETFPELFKVTTLTANNNWELLARQALKFKPQEVIITNDEHYNSLKNALKGSPVVVKAGLDALNNIEISDETDMVVIALVGYSGLLPTIKAIRKGKTIALANKETLVVAGELITSLAKENKVSIVPVDSEHSAIFQCLQGETHSSMSKIILTASGGPFRKLKKEELNNVSVKQALNHPNWDMGAKVTIDSASMMNKGFEMIEAKWLFDCKPENIEILIHPQSIVHSMVQFCDGSVKAQIGVPDMHLPIQYALSYPQRLINKKYILDWSKVHELTFDKPDFDKYPLLQLAFDSIEKGGNLPCVLNAANEIGVKAFLNEKISFTTIPILVSRALQNAEYIANPSLEDLMETNVKTRKQVEEEVKTHCF